MNTLFETMANVDFILFLLSLFGLIFFKHVHKLLVECDPTTFGYVCMILAYFVLKTFK